MGAGIESMPSLSQLGTTRGRKAQLAREHRQTQHLPNLRIFQPDQLPPILVIADLFLPDGLVKVDDPELFRLNWVRSEDMPPFNVIVYNSEGVEEVIHVENDFSTRVPRISGPS